MKVVIFAGGYGTRLSEETDLKPKPMVEIGDRPIIWHIMKYYSHFGFNDFVLLLGYKSYMIKEYFVNYYLHHSDITVDTANNGLEIHNNKSEDWKITLVDTGLHTMTGSRLRKARKYIGDETFMLTYGDGLSDVDLNQLLDFHKSHGKALTLTSVLPEGRFGALELEENKVKKFWEKPKGDGAWINGGFFVCEPEVFDYIESGKDNVVFERGPLESLARSGQLYAMPHSGFWKPMDNIRDKNILCELWENDKAAWKVWSGA